MDSAILFLRRLGLLAAVGLLLTACRAQPSQPLEGERLALAWVYDSGAPINKPPLPAGPVLLTASEAGALLALDLESGQPAWQYAPQGGVWDASFASDGKAAFIGEPGGSLAALDLRSGELLWRVNLGLDVQASPLVDGDVLYVPTTLVGPGLPIGLQGQAVLFALRAQDGSRLWSFESDSYILQTPCKAGDALYTGGSYSNPDVEIEEGGPLKIYALNASDGALRWEHASQDGYVKALYADEHALAYIAYQDFSNGLDAASGERLWRKDTGNWVPSLAGAGEVIYYGSANTVVFAVHLHSGETLWTFNIPGGSFNYLLGAPAIFQDDLYFLTQRGDLFALSASDGSLRWSLPTAATARVGLSVSNGWLFFGDQDGKVYAYRQR
jgi:outer membrane protein assembly factor BamB